MTFSPLPQADGFNAFSVVCLNMKGRFVRPLSDFDHFADGEEISPDQLPEYLKSKIYLPPNVTDVFVYVHGWQNTHAVALESAKRLFSGIVKLQASRPEKYTKLANFVPAFVLVRWPSLSSTLPHGYLEIRDRAAALTEDGDAEFFLASLLGYLDKKNERIGGGKTLASKAGFFIHCLGHSFGGRFITAAITAAGNPTPRTLHLADASGPQARKVLGTAPVNGFDFTVDSMLIFQMAAPASSFKSRLSTLTNKAPLRGPVVLTHSRYDTANCTWHRATEWAEAGIGCSGAAEPSEDICAMSLGSKDHVYTKHDFAKRIVNVDGNAAYCHAGLNPAGAHSDFYYQESVHLALSLANYVHE